MMNQNAYVFHKYYDWAMDVDGDLVPKDDPNAYIPAEKYIYRKQDKIEAVVDKNNRLNNVIKSLKEIASAQYQEKGWVRGEIHEYCTFVETISRFLDEGGLENFINNEAREFGFSEKGITKLDELRKAVDFYADEHRCYEDPNKIVKDPRWGEIRQAAKNVLQILGVENYLDPSKAIFKQALIYRVYKLARPEFQERAWIRERRPDANPFQELVRDFFETSRAGEIINNHKEYEISQDQRIALVQLYEAVKKYWEQVTDPSNFRAILDDPEWQQIQQFAQEILKMFEFNPWSIMQ